MREGGRSIVMQVSLQNRMNYSIFMIMYIQVMHEHSMRACNTIHLYNNTTVPSHSLNSYFSIVITGEAMPTKIGFHALIKMLLYLVYQH